jgi:hypothetical protein
LLADCGGSNDPALLAPPPAAGGIDSIAFSGESAWLSLSNTATTNTAVVRASLPLRTDSAWSGVALGECPGDARARRAPRAGHARHALRRFRRP